MLHAEVYGKLRRFTVIAVCDGQAVQTRGEQQGVR
jgi:hypothetical protein